MNTEKENIPSQENTDHHIVILGQYIKDLSLEIPHAPHHLQKLQKPHLGLNFNINLQKIENHIFEVTLTSNIQAKDKDEMTLYIIDLTYAGLLSVKDSTLTHPNVLIQGAYILFPFVRAILTNLSLEAGLPLLQINPIDFASYYRQRQAEATQNVETSQEENTPPTQQPTTQSAQPPLQKRKKSKNGNGTT